MYTRKRKKLQIFILFVLSLHIWSPPSPTYLTPCSSEVLKKAFLFSCLTGLRKSDIKKLTWDKIQPYGDGGMYVTRRMQKTKELVNNPISDETLELIGFNDDDENRKPTDKVFVGFNDSLTHTPLRNWLKAAGITKHITYQGVRTYYGLDTVIEIYLANLSISF